MQAGRRLDASRLALAAAMGHGRLAVRRRPRVAILATGDELVRPGEPAGPHQIVASNPFAIAALVADAGGGASVGEHDLVQSALAREGMELGFWRVALRPGKPLMHGRLGPMLLLGLPGNPVSSIVCGILFMVPAIRALLGDPAAGEDISEPALLGAP